MWDEMGNVPENAIYVCVCVCVCVSKCVSKTHSQQVELSRCI